MPAIDLSILNQRQTPAFYADVFANRPAAGFVGRIFVSTDTFAFYRDNGTGWDLIGGPGTGTITGAGASGQIALWSGASTIVGDTGLTYDGTANSLTASQFIVTGGTSSQFLKGDGSLDSSAYVTTNIYNGNGTLSAERTVSLNGNNLIFDGGASVARVRLDADTNVARIFSFATNNVARWAFRIDDAETGSNAGSNFAVRRYDDAGSFVDSPLLINRATGQSTFAKKVVIENNAGDQQLQIVSTTAPSLRIDNLQTGATKRAGFGISTASNNFIQGSADQDFCIFNGTTISASPILFGIYDAAAINVQEAARISAARNFLVGTKVDSGQKLIVNGTALISNSLLLGETGVTNAVINTNDGMYFNIDADASGGSPEFMFGKQRSGAGSGGTTFLTINNSGNFGFNTATPLVPYHFAFRQGEGDPTVFTGERMRLQGNDNNGRSNYFTIISGSNAYGGLYVGDNGSGEIGKIRYYNLNNSWEFHSNNALAMTISNAQNLLIGTTTDNGNKLNVSGTIYTNTALYCENTTNGIRQFEIEANSILSQGNFRWRTYGRGIVASGTGTKLNIPFTSQTNINLVTVVRVTVCSADFNSAFGGSLQVTFSVGSLNALSNLSILSSGGSYISATTSGMNVVITQGGFTGAYVYIEYLTPFPQYSIDLGNITLTS